ncbi:MAG: putative molybdenum carrier protein [Planctomycetes bacterium]|nr:putative molybdenum carrier protein [Planctomycetota bacterium]
MFTRIISGGQTGVDRAALDVALALALPCGGWCPQGRRAEGGPIPVRYPLQETPSWVYPQRTRWNVRDSDGTLILTRGQPQGGTGLTVQLARRLGKPYLIVNLLETVDLAAIRAWAATHQVQVLNVAGPRESESPGIYQQAVQLLRELLAPSPTP